MIENFAPIYPIIVIVGGLLSWRTFWLGSYSRSLKDSDPLSVGDDFEAPLTILLTTAPSACECLNYYTGFCAFNSLSADAPAFRVTDWCIVGC